MSQRFGRYEIERELGRGASGIVYLASDKALNRQVALKVLTLPQSIQGVERTQALERFVREARAAAAISHPSVPQIYDAGSMAGKCYIAMEYCHGTNLRDMLRMQGPLAEPTALSVIRQVLDALQAAHRLGICHRDVKPDNVIVLSDGRTKLMDFGVARVAGDTVLTQTGVALGTPAYMSPEQVLGRNVDGRSDLFSVGVLLHEMLTGRRPFGGTTVTQITHAIVHEEPAIAPSIPPHLSAVIAKALCKDPSGRFGSAEEMASVLSATGTQHSARQRLHSPGLAATPHSGAPDPGLHTASPSGTPPAIMGGPSKACPRCGRLGSLDAPTCVCGHVFRTQFSTPPTQMVPTPRPEEQTVVRPGGPMGVPGRIPPGSDVRFCAHCGMLRQPGSTRCARCGRVWQTATDAAPYSPTPPYEGPGNSWPMRADELIRVTPGSHSPVVAVLLSILCLICGGQFYNRQYLKGVVILLGAIVLAPVTEGVSTILAWILGPIDAGLIAGRLNRGETVTKWQWF
ncbi:MAG: serine/threonine protein kinase [Armatimonadetes bacterium]|jgi:serine/threonine protein kinase|nr:serine/threonine protein kinase [Armatimonadota bacterium]